MASADSHTKVNKKPSVVIVPLDQTAIELSLPHPRSYEGVQLSSSSLSSSASSCSSATAVQGPLALQIVLRQMQQDFNQDEINTFASAQRESLRQNSIFVTRPTASVYIPVRTRYLPHSASAQIGLSSYSSTQ